MQLASMHKLDNQQDLPSDHFPDIGPSNFHNITMAKAHTIILKLDREEEGVGEEYADGVANC